MENSLLKQIVAIGMSEEQAAKVLLTVGEFAKEKLPILRGSIDIYLTQELKQIDPALADDILYFKSAFHQD